LRSGERNWATTFHGGATTLHERPDRARAKVPHARGR
jgi:hypothetical protein